MTKKLMSVYAKVTVASAAGIYSTTQNKPLVFDKALIKDLAEINEDFAKLNLKTGKSLFEHLFKISVNFSDEGWHQDLDKADHALFIWGAPDNWLIGKPTSILNEAFNAIQKNCNRQDVPADYMSFILHKLGQPILPKTKLGWGHIREFGHQPCITSQKLNNFV